MHPDLVHPSRERPAQHHAGPAVEAEPLELCPALLALGRDLAHADLVGHDLDRLLALGVAPVERKIYVKIQSMLFLLRLPSR